MKDIVRDAKNSSRNVRLSLDSQGAKKKNSSVLDYNKSFESEMQRLVNLPEIKIQMCKMHKGEFGAPEECNICGFGGI